MKSAKPVESPAPTPIAAASQNINRRSSCGAFITLLAFMMGLAQPLSLQAQQTSSVAPGTPRPGCLRWPPENRQMPGGNPACPPSAVIDYCQGDEVLVRHRVAREGRELLQPGHIDSINLETDEITVHHGHSRSFGFETESVHIDMRREPQRIMRFTRTYRGQDNPTVAAGPDLHPIFSQDHVRYWLTGSEPHGRDLPLNVLRQGSIPTHQAEDFEIHIHYGSESVYRGVVSGVYENIYTPRAIGPAVASACDRNLPIYLVHREHTSADEFDFTVHIQLTDEALRRPLPVPLETQGPAGHQSPSALGRAPLLNWQNLNLGPAFVNAFWIAPPPPTPLIASQPTAPRAPTPRAAALPPAPAARSALPLRPSLFTEGMVSAWILANSGPGQILHDQRGLFNQSFPVTFAQSTLINERRGLPISAQSMTACAQACLDDQTCRAFQLYLRPADPQHLACAMHATRWDISQQRVAYERPPAVPANAAQILFIINRSEAVSPTPLPPPATALTQDDISAWIMSHSGPGQPMHGIEVSVNLALSNDVWNREWPTMLLSLYHDLPISIQSISSCRDICQNNTRCNAFEIIPSTDTHYNYRWTCKTLHLTASQFESRGDFVAQPPLPTDRSRFFFSVTDRLIQPNHAPAAPPAFLTETMVSSWIAANSGPGRPLANMEWDFNTALSIGTINLAQLQTQELINIAATPQSLMACRNLCVNHRTCTTFIIYPEAGDPLTWNCLTMNLSREQANGRRDWVKPPGIRSDAAEVYFFIPSRMEQNRTATQHEDSP